MELTTVLTDINGRPVDINENTNVIMAASIITRQPGTMPYRVVLRLTNVSDHAEWIVHNEVFPEYTVEQNSIKLGRPSYDQGDYFQFQDMVAAYKRWAERATRDALHIGSIFRE